MRAWSGETLFEEPEFAEPKFIVSQPKNGPLFNWSKVITCKEGPGDPARNMVFIWSPNIAEGDVYLLGTPLKRVEKSKMTSVILPAHAVLADVGSPLPISQSKVSH